MRRVAVRGLLALLVAMVLTTLGAALAEAAGVSLQLPGAPEPIPVAGFGVMTGMLGLPGVLIALGLHRWSARPDTRWVQVAVALTALSLVPPFLTGAGAATVATLVVLHLVAAVVVIPVVARVLGDQRPDVPRSRSTAASTQPGDSYQTM